MFAAVVPLWARIDDQEFADVGRSLGFGGLGWSR